MSSISVHDGWLNPERESDFWSGERANSEQDQCFSRLNLNFNWIWPLSVFYLCLYFTCVWSWPLSLFYICPHLSLVWMWLLTGCNICLDLTLSGYNLGLNLTLASMWPLPWCELCLEVTFNLMWPNCDNCNP